MDILETICVALARHLGGPPRSGLRRVLVADLGSGGEHDDDVWRRRQRRWRLSGGDGGAAATRGGHWGSREGQRRSSRGQPSCLLPCYRAGRGHVVLGLATGFLGWTHALMGLVLSYDECLDELQHHL